MKPLLVCLLALFPYITLAENQTPSGFKYEEYGGRFKSMEVFDIETGQMKSQLLKSGCSSEFKFNRKSKIWSVTIKYWFKGNTHASTGFIKADGDHFIGVNNGTTDSTGSKLTQDKDGIISGSLISTIGFNRTEFKGLVLSPVLTSVDE